MLTTIEIQHGTNTPEASIIWLHGLGADGNDFVPVVPELKLPESLNIRFVFPNAPVRPITLNGGMPMPGWYDIKSLDMSGRSHDLAGIADSSNDIQQVIEKENSRGIPNNKIIVAGFSQGGAIALVRGLTHYLTNDEPLAGVIALSTYFPSAESLVAQLSERESVADAPPILMAHGDFDDVVRPEFGAASRDQLQALNIAIDWHTYPMAHSLHMDEINDVSQWIQQVLA